MGLSNVIDKIIVIIREAIIGTAGSEDYTNCKGVYYGDQMSYREYPVICVGAPSLLDEKFPVIAQQAIHDEKYTVEIVAYVKVDDTEANAKQIITLTDSIRAALRADMKPPSSPLGGYCYQSEIGSSRFVFGAKGDIVLRISVTIIEYIKRIVL